jgi:hypothetical protein
MTFLRAAAISSGVKEPILLVARYLDADLLLHQMPGVESLIEHQWQ